LGLRSPNPSGGVGKQGTGYEAGKLHLFFCVQIK